MAIGQVLPRPENGWKRLDDSEKLIKLNGSWTRFGHNGAYNGSYIYCGVNNGFALRTNSSKIRILGDSGWNKRFEVHINGELLEVFSPNISNTSLMQCVYYEKDFNNSDIKTIELINVANHTMNIDCIDIDSNAILLPELSKDYEFPVKIGNLADVETYSSSLIGGEEQLLITREGKLYLTDGNGSYKVISEDIDLSNYYNKTEIDDSLLLKANQDTTYSKEEVDNLIATVEPPAGATHTHSNTDTLINLGNSAGMLTYGGKVVVNNNEYSFRTLPRAKVITNYSSEKGGRLPWLQ